MAEVLRLAHFLCSMGVGVREMNRGAFECRAMRRRNEDADVLHIEADLLLSGFCPVHALVCDGVVRNIEGD